MKKYIAYILLTCLLLTCFAGCKQNDVTPTDITPVDVASTQAKADETGEKLQVETAEQKQNTPSTQQTDSQSLVSEKQSGQKVDPDDIHACVVESGPTFVSDEAFQIWLKQGSGKFEAERSKYIQTNKKENIITYCHPKAALSRYGTLEYIACDDYCEAEFVYRSGKEEFFIVTTGLNDSGTDVLYKEFKKNAENKITGYSCVTDSSNQIQFFISSVEDNCISVRWQQFNRYHAARFMYWTDDNIDDIVSLLVLEQVTVPLNSDHVTQ